VCTVWAYNAVCFLCGSAFCGIPLLSADSRVVPAVASSWLADASFLLSDGSVGLNGSALERKFVIILARTWSPGKKMLLGGVRGLKFAGLDGGLALDDGSGGGVGRTGDG